MRLSPRLEAIREMVCRDPVTAVADIGTDHGYLPIALVSTGQVQRAIASDLNPGPLESARLAVDEAGLRADIDLRLGSGLSTLVPNEVQVAVIAGMGGVLIANLLAVAPEIAKCLSYLILQPMQAQADLRQWLMDNGYTIIEAQIVREGDKYYDILKVKAGTMQALTWTDLNLGFRVALTEDYIHYIKYRIKVQEQVMAGLSRGNRLDQLREAEQELKWMQAHLEAQEDKWRTYAR